MHRSYCLVLNLADFREKVPVPVLVPVNGDAGKSSSRSGRHFMPGVLENSSDSVYFRPLCDVSLNGRTLMKFEFIESPIRFSLHGMSSDVPNNGIGEVGMKLMDELWRLVRQSNTSTLGINYWVYLPGGRIFAGVELQPNAIAPDGLEPLEFEIKRYLKHVHIGPYQALPGKWQALKDELAAGGETIGSPSLEVYGHHCEDPSKTETTILIGLQPRQA